MVVPEGHHYHTRKSISQGIATVVTATFGSLLTLPLKAKSEDVAAALTPLSDEIAVSIFSDSMGLSLREVSYKDSNRVLVDGVKEYASESLQNSVKNGMIIVAIGDRNVEGLSGREVIQIFKDSNRPVTVTFRDPSIFFNELNSTISNSQFISTSVDGDVVNINRLEVGSDLINSIPVRLMLQYPIAPP